MRDSAPQAGRMARAILAALAALACAPSAFAAEGDAGGRRMLLDRNGDGRITAEEVPQRLRARFEMLDADGDGGVAADELARARERAREVREQPEVPKGWEDVYGVAPGPFPVRAVGSLTLHDEARGKDLELRVTYPVGDGPFPIVIWSHGAGGSKDGYQPLVRHWASHGYVCLQPTHEDSLRFRENRGRGLQFQVWPTRPPDLELILDSLDEVEASVPGLRGKLDREAIGVGGHSFGAHTAQLLAGASAVNALTGRRSDWSDPRPKAFVLISPQGIDPNSALGERSWTGMTRPFLLVTGTQDGGRGGQPYTWRLDPFRLSPPGDKYLLVIQDADHGFGGITGTRRRRAEATHLASVLSATTAFWDAQLKGSAEAAAFLRSGELPRASGGKAELTAGDE
jgi:predicted dienelactone hydrolase